MRPRPDPECSLDLAEQIARLRLARTDRIGPATFRRLLWRCGSAQEAILALPDLARGGAGIRVAGADLAERELDSVRRAGATMLFLDGPGYPALLALLADAPPCLAAMGDPARAMGEPVAIVGSRNASAGGCLMAETLAEALAGTGHPIISGLARGIDAAAHGGAMRTGVTVAAVAGGIDVAYPPEHAKLQARIAAEGLVLAESPLGTAPQARHFPRRNRVIAGLALGVVVVEATARSGSLITARIALEAGREIFAVPGSPLDPRAQGPNGLIRQGAHLTERAEDVRQNLPSSPLAAGVGRLKSFGHGFTEPAPEAPAPPPRDQPTDRRLIAALEGLVSPVAVSVDDLMGRCQVSAAVMNAALLELELAGRINFLPGNRVARHPGPDAAAGVT